MPFNPGFKALPGGEDLISIPEAVLKTMSTDQRTSYTLVEAVKKGMLPKEMQEILCGPLCHVRFVTNATAQCNNYHIMERTHISRHPRHCVTQTGGWQLLRELSTCGQGSTDNLRVLESLAKFCLQSWQVWGSWGANQRRWEMSSHSTWEQEHGTRIQSAWYSPCWPAPSSLRGSLPSARCWCWGVGGSLVITLSGPGSPQS